MQIAIEKARELSETTLNVSGLKIPIGFDQWMDEVVFGYKQKTGKRTSKQEILRRGLELVYVEVADNGGFSADPDAPLTQGGAE